ncbi:unnamed protein product [Lactuca saligna]|uniref:Uncharacterized protein n=1 Tax=Lactuca saligna TaxID=75948 RepID=A0AA36ELD5_LACSI|nr:unnamed protein product [Lactuca saligna]
MMGVELDKKYAIIAIKACYRSASKHPVVVVLILFTIWFYRSFPLLFSLLVYASPILVSTAVLLGTLLLFGHQNASKIRKEGKQQQQQHHHHHHHHQIHNLRVRAIEDTGIGGKGVRSEARENAIGKKNSDVSNVNLTDDHPRVQIIKRRNSIDNSVLMAYKKLKEEAKNEVCNHNQKIDLSGEKIMFVNRCAQFQPPHANNTEDHKRWETGSQHSESSFPTASMVGALPSVHDLPPLLQPQVTQNNHMLHVHRSEPQVPHHHAQTLHAHRSESEVPHHAHTLHVHRSEPEVPHHAHMLHAHRNEPEVPHHHAQTLHVHRNEPEAPHHHAQTLHAHRNEAEVPHHAQMSNVNAYAASNHSLESDDHDDDDEEEARTWTEDDQKNLRNLGKSEIERNQHMENLVARQKAIRNMRIQAEENLVNINLDISYSSTPIASTRRNSNASTRRNSMDVPYDFNETVVESTPSDMMPRTNTYDLPYDSSGPTFQSDALSFQPNHEGGGSRQNEGYYTFGASENVSQRSRSSDDDDMVKVHHVTRDGRVYEFKASVNGGETRKEKSNFESSHRHESSDVASSTLGWHVHNDEVKTSDVGEKGYQGKSSSESSSSSSSFSDVSDHLDDEEEEYDYRSAVMPSTPERQIQEQQRKNIQQSPKLEHGDGRVPQRPPKGLTSWFGWKP